MTSSGGNATPSLARPAQLATAIPGDAIYCSTAQRFSADLRTKPVVKLLSRTLQGASRAGVEVSLSKISTLTLTVRRAGTVVWTNSATVEGGTPRLLWVTPARGGIYSVTVEAVDLAGNRSSTSGTIKVLGAGPTHTIEG